MIADFLPVLKGKGSLRTDHRFVVYRLHLHHFIVGGDYPPRSVRPTVDHELSLQPITPIPHHESPLSADLRDSGICIYVGTLNTSNMPITGFPT